MHSATKYLGGHSDVIAGLVVTNSETLGKQLLSKCAWRRSFARKCQSHSTGIQTLSVRMDRQQKMRLRLLIFLKNVRSDKNLLSRY